ncbi:LysR family transcriptional regulator [Ralstonia holmesii]|uniref:HTH-type transcriptional regulator HdfR n=1 Tax=Ralstonia holmesii TaxID=3058602 RepID=A0ABC8QFA6_9RALS|nr:LysR family transcriptional regulator [Ralstonia sp. LMG 32967]CAJ0796778.1 HTH-type transcriptional regulator HdfR [Ralstonia sp. LMG 32967]CAJ0805837.1 HTH-type transcriptional regulator HdfR [Ralstonia sp. LMG 32967]
MNFKELEALYWAAQLGGFAPAADKLHTVQSAISKRIQELEEELGVRLFDRSGRSNRLTDKGHELVEYAKRLLDLRDEAMNNVANASVVTATLRIGVTELTAMTWLPKLTEAMQTRYPKVALEPDVDASVNLREKILADELDVAIVPDAYNEARFVCEPVGEVECVWMCKRGLVDHTRTMTLDELSRFTLLANRSGAGMIYERWFKSVGFAPAKRLSSNSVLALLSLAAAGMGVTYVQARCFERLLESGPLVELDVHPPLPNLGYVALYKTSRASELISTCVELAKASCDFSRIFPV